MQNKNTRGGTRNGSGANNEREYIFNTMTQRTENILKALAAALAALLLLHNLFNL